MKLNRLKSIFTPKRVAIFFMSIFLILFFAGGCSFKYMDWQYYKFKNLVEKESGIYVVNDELYDDMIVNNLQGKEYLLSAEEIRKTIYELYTQTQYSRIYTGDYKKYHYYDSDKNKWNILSFYKIFAYKNYGIFLTGDEGSGIRLRFFDIVNGLEKSNIFYVNEYNNNTLGEQNDK